MPTIFTHSPLYEANADDYRDKLQTERTLEEQAYGLMVDVFVFDDHFRSAACLKVYTVSNIFQRGFVLILFSGFPKIRNFRVF